MINTEELVRLWKDSGKDLYREQILSRFEGMVKDYTSRVNRGIVPLKDIEQEARLGILKAIDTFDPARGCKFSTHAGENIKVFVRRYLRKNRRIIHNPTHLHDARIRLSRLREAFLSQNGREPTPDELRQLAPQISDSVFPHALLPEMDVAPLDSLPEEVRERVSGHEVEQVPLIGRILLRSCVQSVPDDERQVLCLYHFEGLSISAISQRLSISRRRATELLSSAEFSLRNCLTDVGITNPQELLAR